LLILHAAFSSPVLWVWGEGEGGGPEAAKRRGRPPKTPSPAPPPFSATATLLAEAAAAGGATLEGTRALSAVAWLPTSAEKPLPSSPVLGELLDDPASVKLTAWGVSALPMGGRAMVEWLAACLGKTSLAPGVLLGTQAAFRRHFFLPIQTASDPVAARRLKRITGPFILRRLKTERAVIKDLPEKQEMKVFCTLTKEQASLYQAVLDDVGRELSKASGIQRKGLVLSTLLRLKQACNHPAHLLGERSPLSRGKRGGGRSGSSHVRMAHSPKQGPRRQAMQRQVAHLSVTRRPGALPRARTKRGTAVPPGPLRRPFSRSGALCRRALPPPKGPGHPCPGGRGPLRYGTRDGGEKGPGDLPRAQTSRPAAKGYRS